MFNFVTSKLKEGSTMGFVFGLVAGQVSTYLIYRNLYIESVGFALISAIAFMTYKYNFCEDEVETVYVTQLNDEPNEEYLERLRETIEDASNKED